METKVDVVVVSAFGRGNWLAAELARQGLSTTMVDVSDALGRWAPEDWEGPFGYFQSEAVTESQSTRLHEEDFSEGVDEGFVFWLNDGVLDTSGPLSQYLFELRQVPMEQQNYLSRYDALPADEREKVQRQIRRAPFRESWFSHLGHAIASPVFLENAQAANFGRPLSLYSPHFIRRVSRRGYEQNLQWVKSWGADILPGARIRDISVNSRFVQSLEVQSDWTGVLTGEQVVWCLSSEETHRLAPKIADELFGGRIMKPSWSWQRYRFQLSGGGIVDDLPLHFLMIDDLQLTWAHENFALVQRSVNESDFDVWMRLPASQRFHRNYLRERGEAVAQTLRRRLPGVEVKILNLPQEHLYDEADLGPARFPVFDEKTWAMNNKKSWINLHYDGPECWPLLNWNGAFEYQKGLRMTLLDWKRERDERREKMRTQADAHAEARAAEKNKNTNKNTNKNEVEP